MGIFIMFAAALACIVGFCALCFLILWGEDKPTPKEKRVAIPVLLVAAALAVTCITLDQRPCVNEKSVLADATTYVYGANAKPVPPTLSRAYAQLVAVVSSTVQSGVTTSSYLKGGYKVIGSTEYVTVYMQADTRRACIEYSSLTKNWSAHPRECSAND